MQVVCDEVEARVSKTREELALENISDIANLPHQEYPMEYMFLVEPPRRYCAYATERLSCNHMLYHPILMAITIVSNNEDPQRLSPQGAVSFE